jgi:hypothetical protein
MLHKRTCLHVAATDNAAACVLSALPCHQAGPFSHAVLVPTSAQPQPLLTATGNITSDSSSTPDDSSSSSEVHAGSSGLFRLASTGLDSVTFLLSAGPAEPLRPLAATASGGEAARVMLALKAAPAAAAAAAAILSQQQLPIADAGSSSSSSSDGLVSVGPPVLVMDELDAGLGSRLGEPVGRLLAGLVGAAGQPAAACQVLMVTHTPQVGEGCVCMVALLGWTEGLAAASNHVQLLRALCNARTCCLGYHCGPVHFSITHLLVPQNK